jgi:uncharacterized protein (TIGR03067 family)
MQAYGILFMALGLVIGAEDNKKDSGQGDVKMLQGSWTVVSFEANGEKVPEDVAKKMKLTVKDKDWTLERGDQTNKGTITLDPSKKPKAFDAMLEGSGETVHGIYEFKGDTLTMCWSAPDNERPTAFKGDDGKTLVVYKKAKSE